METPATLETLETLETRLQKRRQLSVYALLFMGLILCLSMLLEAVQKG